ncbi:hypothetical protein C8F04DRAFT_1237829 [Mycena alexandri]|uniref:HNH nuclease domain-containing protein n=1 Tax=Mycena alexandri TaxID=1745969 RepID=A0AAD6WUK1_9AGAR|nr:hypothetical protein C8F04DRAFT_1237829 [Mycena alexandri]
MISLAGPFPDRVHRPAPVEGPNTRSILVFQRLETLAVDFLRIDTTPVEGRPEGGLPYFLVLEMAQILTGNSTGVLFRHDYERYERAALRLEDMGNLCLTARLHDTVLPGTYFYYAREELPDGTFKYRNDYKVLPDFRSWQMPSLQRRPSWWKTTGPDPVQPVYADHQTWKHIDKCCLITGATRHLQTAHVLPEVERPWLQSNILVMRDIGVQIISSPSNTITLRADLNAHSFDKGEFVIVPCKGRWTLYVIRGNCPDILVAHGAAVDVPGRVIEDLMYARLAFNTFEMSKLQRSAPTASDSASQESGKTKKKRPTTPSNDPDPGEPPAKKAKSTPSQRGAGSRGAQQEDAMDEEDTMDEDAAPNDDEGAAPNDDDAPSSSSSSSLPGLAGGPTTPPSVLTQFFRQQCPPPGTEKVSRWQEGLGDDDEVTTGAFEGC